jgi:hypothetical protein
MTTHSAEPVGGLDSFPNWLLGYLTEKLFADVILPGLHTLHDKFLYFWLFGWMFHVRTKDGKLVAELFAKEVMNVIREENEVPYHEKVENYTWP